VSEKMNLLVATANAGKLREMRALLALPGLRLISIADLEAAPDIEEGFDYADNARRKAVSSARAAGMWAVADDSGLEVDVLGGAPGPRSARLAGEGEVKASDITLVEGVELLNPDHHVATLSRGGKLHMELRIRKSRGYVAADRNFDDDLGIGWIPIDSVHSPVKKVNYLVEAARLGLPVIIRLIDPPLHEFLPSRMISWSRSPRCVQRSSA
jgi:non-canonical purine NTP pyrophosphatase (RdgB/HAM1 family)